MAINQDTMPEDVLTEILSRLPVKSLLQFKSVSKYWHALIQSPIFISLRYTRTLKNDSFLVRRFLTPSSESDISLVSKNGTPIHDLYAPFPGPKGRGVSLVGSSNGIVCLTNSSSEIVLWNPATRESRVLPERPYHAWHTSNLGFAFDPKTNDYIVLSIATFFHNCANERVHIYLMSTDSWREIVVKVPKGIARSHQPFGSTWLDGVFYWIAPAFGPSYYKTIAFHMFHEVFGERFFPKERCIKSTSSLGVLRDSLAIVTLELAIGSGLGNVDIWLRDVNGARGIWNKKYTIGPILGCCKACTLLRNGELLLVRGNKCRMVSFNLDTQIKKKYCEVYDDSVHSYQFQVILHTENLVSVKRRVYD